MKTGKEIYDQVTKNLKAYESGDLLGGDPYSPITRLSQVEPEVGERYKSGHDVEEFYPEDTPQPISDSRSEEIAEYLLHSIIKAQDHNWTGELDAYFKGCKDGVKAAIKELKQ
jgi:hypothetical protein